MLIRVHAVQVCDARNDALGTSAGIILLQV